MKLLRGVLARSAFKQGVVASIGNFDGVHLGHQHLISALKKKAYALNLPLVLVLFEPQPREYFNSVEAPARISSLREKLDMLKSCQVDYIYCIRFNATIAQTSAYDFACTYLFSRLNAKYLLIGADFRFGKNRAGSIDLLKVLGEKYACEVEVAPDFCIDGKKISSTTIRSALAEGNLTCASHYLGRSYSICGRVIHGDGRGRQWGIPTANLNLNRPSLPLKGVFAVEVRLNSKTRQAVANVGCRPTIDGHNVSVEIHLFDFDESIYGDLLQVFFLHKLRDEVKFTSVDALITQIHQDIVATKIYFNQKSGNE